MQEGRPPKINCSVKCVRKIPLPLWLPSLSARFTHSTLFLKGFACHVVASFLHSVGWWRKSPERISIPRTPDTGADCTRTHLRLPTLTTLASFPDCGGLRRTVASRGIHLRLCVVGRCCLDSEGRGATSEGRTGRCFRWATTRRRTSRRAWWIGAREGVLTAWLSALGEESGACLGHRYGL